MIKYLRWSLRHYEWLRFVKRGRARNRIVLWHRDTRTDVLLDCKRGEGWYLFPLFLPAELSVCKAQMFMYAKRFVISEFRIARVYCIRDQ